MKPSIRCSYTYPTGNTCALSPQTNTDRCNYHIIKKIPPQTNVSVKAQASAVTIPPARNTTTTLCTRVACFQPAQIKGGVCATHKASTLSLKQKIQAQAPPLVTKLPQTIKTTTAVDKKPEAMKLKKEVRKPKTPDIPQSPGGKAALAAKLAAKLIGELTEVTPVPVLTPEQQVLLEGGRIMQDFYRYVEVNLKITTKTEGLKKLELNDEQLMLVAYVIQCLKDGTPIRVIILKGRQQGISTVVEALIYWWTATHKYQQSKIVAHDSETAEKLYSMFKRYYDNSKDLFKPKTKYNTRNDLTFDRDDNDKGLKSQIDTSSAENTSAGRGQTIHWLHGSEIAKWRNGAELVAGLMQAVPLAKNTAIFLESTANGMGDYFHKTWVAAKLGKNQFKPFFFPWNMHKEYQLPVPQGFQRTTEEQELVDEYQLTNEQLMWRRAKMSEFAAKPDDFFQEYPINEAEAFLASGKPRFNVRKIVQMQENCTPGRQVEIIEDKQTKDALQTAAEAERDPKNTWKVIEVPNSPLTLWQPPKEGKEYVIGVDVAEGINADFSVATVVDKEEQAVVARWRGDEEPSNFGEVVEQLGRWYNLALVGVEINNHGLTTVQRLRDMLYPNLYRNETKIDERFAQYTSKLGWKSTVQTKKNLINNFAEAIAKDQVKDPDLVATQEYLEYVVDDRGRTNAQEGSHDDCVISTAIAYMLFDWVPIKKEVRIAPSYVNPRFLANQQKYSTLKKRIMVKR